MKVDLIVIARAEINQNMLVAPEKHDGAWVPQFVHVIEVGDFLYFEFTSVKALTWTTEDTRDIRG